MKAQLNFENTFARELPGDSGPHHISRATPGVAYTHVKATPVASPEILIWSDEAAALIDLDRRHENIDELARVFSGNQILPGMSPLATRYGGHQFGNWAGQLGDGRAMSLGEVLNSHGERWEIQLKGAGLTPYSRRADGRAVLRSSLREFLCSEALFHLGVPTTRALCCVLTGDKVVRDMFYDGHPEEEPGAITTRLAPSFLRFGHFEILAAHDEQALLRDLIAYSIRHHFRELLPPPSASPLAVSDNIIVKWFETICVSTAKLMVEWSRVGFVHGVMNTDNLSILGLTIDFGPYGFIDGYDPDWTPNTTDADTRRYRFGAQPSIGFWNLARLAEVLLSLNISQSSLEGALEKYKATYEQSFLQLTADKLGLADIATPEAFELVRDLEVVLRSTETDMTIFYRQLIELHKISQEEKQNEPRLLDLFREVFYQEATTERVGPLLAWLPRYLAVTKNISSEQIAVMEKTSPYFILRNYLVQEALDDLAQGDRKKLDNLMTALKTPYEANSATKPFFKRRPEWARTKAGCSALSCSS